MYHLLLISEDRLFLKKIYPLLEDENRFCIHLVPFSMDALESFKKFHADAVILDTTVFIPYENILNDLKECQWNYSVILISSKNEKINLQKNIYSVVKEDVSREIFEDFFDMVFGRQKEENVTLQNSFFSWKGNNVLDLTAETYHLVYIRSFEKNNTFTLTKVKSFEKEISSYAKLNTVFAKDNEFFFLLARQNLKSEFNFVRLGQDAFEIFGARAAMLFDSSINRKKVLSECKQMKKLSSYAYFFNGKAFSIQDLNTKEALFEEKILHAQCQPLLQALLSGDKESAAHIVRELYYKTIKQYMNFQTLEYIRLQLNFFNFLFGQDFLLFDFDCLEEEIDFILTTNLFVKDESEKKKSRNVMDSVMKIYNSFQFNISLEGIAKELGRNKIYLNRIYKENFNLTILDTLQYLRLEHAKFYLVYTKLKVSEIAAKTGFNDIGYFSKFFHHETGKTALEYRNQKSEEKL